MTGIVLMAGAFATLLSQWGLIPLLKMSSRTAVLCGAALGGLGTVMTGMSDDFHGIIIGFALASLGFGLFRPGFTAGALLSVPRREIGRAQRQAKGWQYVLDSGVSLHFKKNTLNKYHTP